MGLFSGFSDFLFGKNDPKQQSLLSESQMQQLGQLNSLNQQYNPQTFQTLGQLAGTPQSSYSASGANFQAGVYDPAMRTLNQQIANSNHSSNLHSSANAHLKNQLRQNTMDKLSQQRYQDALNQQKLRQQAQEQAYGRQLQALQQLAGLSSQGLGRTQENIVNHQGGLVDFVTAVGAMGQGIGSMMGE